MAQLSYLDTFHGAGYVSDDIPKVLPDPGSSEVWIETDGSNKVVNVHISLDGKWGTFL